MSRVGKYPVSIPEGVAVTIDNNIVKAKGKLGELSLQLTPLVIVEKHDNLIQVNPVDKDEKKSRMMWGTTKRLIENIVKGVSQGFVRNLEINGVGFKAAIQDKVLVLNLGFSHEIRYPIPQDITIVCPKPTAITISGTNKEKVGKIASDIRGYKPPEPYKGKGIKYDDEVVLRKEGKKK
ncbi:MAG: 50S ribosomal protein L6 [Alphaproteobacteria bacterium]|nr:50S ribosomal protein L6 [Alphaproteobacteria bacterium]